MGLMDWLCCYEFSIAFGSETDLQVLSSFWMHIGKVGCVFPMVILSEFRMGQYRDEDHPEDALHFTWFL